MKLLCLIIFLGLPLTVLATEPLPFLSLKSEGHDLARNRIYKAYEFTPTLENGIRPTQAFTQTERQEIEALLDLITQAVLRMASHQGLIHLAD